MNLAGTEVLPVEVVVGIGEDAVLGHPEAEQRSKEEQRRQQQVEASSHQATARNHSKPIGHKLQRGVQETQDKSPRRHQLRHHLANLLQVDLHREVICSLFLNHLQLHVWVAVIGHFSAVNVLAE